MLPPGLGFVALSDRAWKRTESAKLPRFYFDLRAERKSQQQGTSAYTPAVSLVFGLRASLQLMRQEGLERMYARHERLARATRAAATALGLKLLAPEDPSPAATGILVPESVNSDKLLDYLRDRMGITFAEGQDQLQGKVIRIAHLGHIGSFDVLVAIGALEMALKKFGVPVKLGRGVAAAQEILMEALP
jgi:aspartate aminotransferase-like enzyme